MVQLDISEKQAEFLVEAIDLLEQRSMEEDDHKTLSEIQEAKRQIMSQLEE